jgi:tryptophanyl-tRNA synthetase
MSQSITPRVFSGMQPTGNLHLGNYLGAMLNWIKMQDTHETVYCVVDMHAITLWQEPPALRQAIRDVTSAFMACGLDPRRSIMFNQSQVSAHAELGWIFNCVARLGWMNRMTQFKEKAGKDKEKASVGLYTYPTLMAADILAYRATHVPVGEDQKQHLELTRDIAQKFNTDFAQSIAEAGFGDGFFPLTEPVIQGPATRVMSLRDGTKKMSKSDPSDLSRINLTDTPDDIGKKIRKAKTDADGIPSEAEGLKGRPEAENLVGIYAALAGITVADTLKQFGGGQFSGFKSALAELAVARLSPVTAEMRRYQADTAHVDAVLADGAARARAIADPILRDVKQIVGFIQS